jgi:hypothetical protein
MALRYELSSVWARAAVAGCAFVVLGCGMFMSRRMRLASSFCVMILSLVVLVFPRIAAHFRGIEG